jgi:hypothetical protein
LQLETFSERPAAKGTLVTASAHCAPCSIQDTAGGGKFTRYHGGQARSFATFAPVAVAAIGTLPLPVMHCSIVIHIARRDGRRQLTQLDGFDLGVGHRNGGSLRACFTLNHIEPGCCLRNIGCRLAPDIHSRGNMGINSLHVAQTGPVCANRIQE